MDMEQRISEMYPWVDQNVTPIPLTWNPKDKFSYISLGQNGLKLYYKGPGKSQKDAAAVRATHPIPVSCGLYYFEVKVVSRGKEGYIGIGLCLEDVNLNRLPGWDKGSYGYHGDDGHSFSCSGTGKQYGPTFTTGDVIGCGVDLVNNRCFYTKNGHELGYAFMDLPANIYPCVGLQSIGEIVETNFGQQPFVYDLSTMRKELKLEARSMIVNYQPHLSRGEWEQALQKIVSDYLVHNGYYTAAESFAKSTGIEIKEKIASISNRQNIQKLILQGKISEAIASTQELYPGVLEKNPNLIFRLKVRQFIEMVCGCDAGHLNGKEEKHTVSRRTRVPSPRDFNRRHREHTNGFGADHSNGHSVICDSDMETEIVVEETVNEHEMDVEGNLISLGSHDGNHLNGSSHNGDVPQSMDFDDEDEENRGICDGNTEALTRTLSFGKELYEFFSNMRLDQAKTAENNKLMMDAFSLLAYPDPWKSPLQNLLDPVQREPVCAALNSAILGADRQSTHPVLKIIVAQCKKLFPLMAKRGNGAIAFTNIFEVLRSVGNDQSGVLPLISPTSTKSLRYKE